MSIAPSSWPSSTWSRGSKPSAAKSRGVPTVLQDDEVVLAADRHALAEQVADFGQPGLEGGFQLVPRGVGLLDQVGELLGPARAAPLAPPRRPSPPAGRGPSAQRAAPRSGRWRRGAAWSAASRSSTSDSDSSRPRWDARTRSGSLRSTLTSITAASLVGTARPTPPSCQRHSASERFVTLTSRDG